MGAGWVLGSNDAVGFVLGTGVGTDSFGWAVGAWWCVGFGDTLGVTVGSEVGSANLGCVVGLCVGCADLCRRQARARCAGGSGS